MSTITTFGEIMMRISPEKKGERLSQANSFVIEPGGSESNVAIALSNLGLRTNFITKLPKNPLSVKIIQYLRQFNIDTSNISVGGDKLGIYWTENGIGPRNSFVIYDRNYTAFSGMTVDDFKLEDIFKNSTWFHFSGISPSLSENVNSVLKNIISKINIPYSVDLNFRSKLWNWVKKDPILIKKTMENLCEKATLISGNENDFNNIFGVGSKSVEDNDKFDETADRCFARFPQLKFISISNRAAISASSNIWNGLLFVKGDNKYKYIGKKYKLEPIEDRVGTGDSFVAGIIYGIINNSKYSYQESIDFATTLGALNHTTLGDASRFTHDEVWKVIENNGTGRIIR